MQIEKQRLQEEFDDLNNQFSKVEKNHAQELKAAKS